MQESIPAGAAEAPPIERSAATETSRDGSLADPRALQILSTEHWSLLASRSLSYNEIFTRASMFLSFLAASLVALGLIATATGFTSQLALLAAVVLATDLFIGLATLRRVIDASQEEIQCVVGMNRIRHAYREMVPAVEPYFSTPFHDDSLSVLSVYGIPAHGIRGNIAHGLTTAPAMVGVVDAVVAAALCSVIALGLGAPLEIGLLAGIAGFFLVFGGAFYLGFSGAVRSDRRRVARFPAPPPASDRDGPGSGR